METSSMPSHEDRNPGILRPGSGRQRFFLLPEMHTSLWPGGASDAAREMEQYLIEEAIRRGAEPRDVIRLLESWTTLTNRRAPSLGFGLGPLGLESGME